MFLLAMFLHFILIHEELGANKALHHEMEVCQMYLSAKLRHKHSIAIRHRTLKAQDVTISRVSVWLMLYVINSFTRTTLKIVICDMVEQQRCAREFTLTGNAVTKANVASMAPTVQKLPVASITAEFE